MNLPIVNGPKIKQNMKSPKLYIAIFILVILNRSAKAKNIIATAKSQWINESIGIIRYLVLYFSANIGIQKTLCIKDQFAK